MRKDHLIKLYDIWDSLPNSHLYYRWDLRYAESMNEEFFQKLVETLLELKERERAFQWAVFGSMRHPRSFQMEKLKNHVQRHLYKSGMEFNLEEIPGTLSISRPEFKTDSRFGPEHETVLDSMYRNQPCEYPKTSIDALDWHGLSLFQHAVRCRSPHLEPLLAKGANPLLRNHYGTTPLGLYCQRHLSSNQSSGFPVEKIVEILLKAGEKVDVRCLEAETPLIHMLGSKGVETITVEDSYEVPDPVKAIVKGSRYADFDLHNRNREKIPYHEKPNNRLSDDLSPFQHWTWQSNRDSSEDRAALQLARILLKHGASPNACGIMDLSPVQMAAAFGYFDTLMLLLRHGGILNSIHPDTGYHPLMYAIAYADYETVQELIQTGSDLNHICKKGQSPLHLAVLRKNEAILGLILQTGPNPDSQDFQGKGALHLAAELRDIDLISLLIGAGANPNLQDHRGDTPLMTSIQHSAFNDARFLIRKGSNLKIRNRRGLSALEVARDTPGEVSQRIARMIQEHVS